ncbi:MAG: IS3 family transposase [Clostridiaceae bacterium]|nr:IS3 family transposase [Clostridiaceae bacterium]
MRQEAQYQAIKQLHEEKAYPLVQLCAFFEVWRSAYYKWQNRKPSQRELENQLLLSRIIEIYKSVNGIYGYRRITLTLNRHSDTRYNVKRIRRLMRKIGLHSVIRRKRKNYVRVTPQVTAENLLARQFQADAINQKWLTDVTELAYGNSQKSYLSAIFDMRDRSIVSFCLGHSNNVPLVLETLDRALAANPGAKPLFHSDRGIQYTSGVFKRKLDDAGLVQSMSRIGRCIDNGPMEGFWGTLKAEMYHLNRFYDYDNLRSAVENYIHFYNFERYQKNLNGLTPLEFRSQAMSTE